MNAYEAKIAARKDRLEGLAAKARHESNAKAAQASTMASVIPLAQPIHGVADRNYRDKIVSKMQKSVELDRKAEYYEQKAAAVGKGGISSDDPDAIKKLQAELASVVAAQEKMKEANRLIRKGDREGLGKLGFTPQQVTELFEPDYCGRVGFASYVLSNNNANARRIEKRIKALSQNAERETVETEEKGYTYREDSDENRVMFLFRGKPGADIRQILKSHAFKWSPSRGAWVRHLNNAGIWAGQCVRKKLDLSNACA